MIEADRHVYSTMLNVISCMRVRSTYTYKIQEHCTRILCIKYLPVVYELYLIPVIDAFLQHECGVCDTCIEEEVLIWIRLYYDYNRSHHPTIPPIHIVTQQSRSLHRDRTIMS